MAKLQIHAALKPTLGLGASRSAANLEKANKYLEEENRKHGIEPVRVFPPR